MGTSEELDAFIKNLPATSEAYRSWGQVSILTIGSRNADAASSDKKIIDAIFAKRKSINYVLITTQEYASTVREEIPPILDDQAQLLGVSIRVADVSNEKNVTSNVLKALSSRYAAVCSDGRCICVGGTLDDAYIAAQLLEKTSKAFIEAKYLGGAKSINRLEAWAMQMYYQFKYSREAKKE